jgi:hypothetical protein
MGQALQRRLRAISARLVEEYDGVFSRETVEAVVANSLERLVPIAVTTHLPADPAISVGRMCSETFAGIAPHRC